MVLIFCCYLFLIATIHSGTAPKIAHASSGVPNATANATATANVTVYSTKNHTSSSVPYLTVNSTRPLRDGESLVSSYGNFKLGFFSTGGSKNRYLGIWFNADPNSTVVWVANRENPLTDSSGVVKFDDRGSLIIANGNGSIFWSSNTSGLANNPFAQLEDSGNFVLKSVDTNSTERTLWQSFDHPTDTLLPGMGLGTNRLTGLEANLSSWKATDDPTRGNFTLQFSQGRYPEMIITQDSKKLYRIGLLNGDPRYPMYSVGFTFDEDEAIYKLVSSSNLSRIGISPEGLVQSFAWNEEKREWSHDLLFSADQCDKYELCGPYGSCNTNNSQLCSCLEGFVPKNPRDWSMANWTGGCIRETPLTCSNDEFLNYSSVKLPETLKLNITNYTIENSLSLNECSSRCASDCSCTAYTDLNNTEGDGSDCVLWSGELVDIREYSEGERGQPIYIKKAVSLPGRDDHRNTKSKINVRKLIVIIISSVLASGLLTLVLALALYQKKKRQRKRKFRDLLQRNSKNKGQKDDAEITLFDLATIAQATNNFSLANKLGEGGFGPVYKGILKDGQEIAVKKLSKSSRQGPDEFKNEVMYIAKLQHRNLVKMLGCCIQADERMLVYEFMPNKSLDFFIFDQTRSTLLDLPKRFQIINGIARGLLYLHQDSRLRIVHRDLKGGNILLDSAMNPKISDFGLARSFVGNETEANTNKVVGTFGYMSPEYAIDGIYSTKSDVFSFGVMVLEIVSGKRNRGFYCNTLILTVSDSTV